MALGREQEQPHTWATPPPPQVSGEVQEPQSTTPHPVLKGPQEAPRFAQDFARHPHWFVSPPPPHVFGVSHSPQGIASAQPSETQPQEAPSWVHDLGLHVPVPHRLGPAPPQVCPPPQFPHSTTPPQPSGMLPQSAFAFAQVVGVHSQRLGVPLPPHCDGGGHPPQLSTALHPSETNPQSASSPSHVPGSHLAEPQRFGPSPPQTLPSSHDPQSRMPPQPSVVVPQLAPRELQVVGKQEASGRPSPTASMGESPIASPDASPEPSTPASDPGGACAVPSSDEHPADKATMPAITSNTVTRLRISLSISCTPAPQACRNDGRGRRRTPDRVSRLPAPTRTCPTLHLEG